MPTKLVYSIIFLFLCVVRGNLHQRTKRMEGNDNKRDEIYSKSVRAGKRTYFFDVKSTRGNDYYLTITESKKRFSDDGKFFYEKHKLFLYKEDFDKFGEGLQEVIDYIKREQPYTVSERSSDNDQNDYSYSDNGNHTSDNTPVEVEASDETKRFSDVDFDDLGSDNTTNHEG